VYRGNKKIYPDATFADKLKGAWLRSGLTAEQLANKVGVERKSIYNYCNGYSSPNSVTLMWLCRALDVSADYLLGLK